MFRVIPKNSPGLIKLCKIIKREQYIAQVIVGTQDTSTTHIQEL